MIELVGQFPDHIQLFTVSGQKHKMAENQKGPTVSLSNKTIQYQSGEQIHQGYFAWDDNSLLPRPGVIVIHEWWGLNEYIKMRTDMLVEQGYCALAIDMYGNGMKAESPDQAGQAMSAVLDDMETGAMRLQAGYDALVAQSQVDPNRLAAVGYCFGGAMALHMARMGMPVDAVVSFHGALGAFHTPQPGGIKARILVCHGAEDAMVSMDDVAGFKQEMRQAKADCEVLIHEGAKHGFTNKEADQNADKYGIPLGYDADADAQSWTAMISLFEEAFG